MLMVSHIGNTAKYIVWVTIIMNIRATAGHSELSRMLYYSIRIYPDHYRHVVEHSTAALKDVIYSNSMRNEKKKKNEWLLTE